MRVISIKKLRTFWEKYRAAEKPLRAWYHEAKIARWKNFTEIKRHYPSADVLPNNRVIFDIKGNTYRIVVQIRYAPLFLVFIRFIGTHADYDRIDATTV